MKIIVLNEKKKKEIDEILSKFNSYKMFSQCQRMAYRVAELYNIRVCPYCNINYTYTVYSNKGFVCRPDFDHFELRNPQNELKRDNLIPSCQQCNSRIKHDTPFFRVTHVHPFSDDFDSLAEFLIDIKKIGALVQKKSFDILCKPKSYTSRIEKKKVENSVRDFGIEDRYRFHKDTVCEILKHGYLYNKNRYEEIGNLVASNQSLMCSFHSLLFPDIDCDINQTSLGKLKRDVSRKIKEYVSK